MKIRFAELNEAHANPKAFRKKLREGGGEPTFFRYSYYQALVYSIYHFHKNNNDPIEGGIYLENSLAKFTGKHNRRQKEHITDLFDWYIEVYFKANLTTFEVGQNIQITPEFTVVNDVRISGQINRVDMVSGGGYIAWMFRNIQAVDWTSELSMPLIQYELSERVLKVPVNEVSVGIYSFPERKIEQICYSEDNINKAKNEFESLMKYLGLAT